MGSAIGERIKTKYSVVVFDKFQDKTKSLSGVEAATNSIDLVNKTDVVILAVKPQDFQAVLDEIKPFVKDRLIISIAAGRKTEYIEKILGKVRVVRVMPNIGAQIGKAESSLYQGKYVRPGDLNFTQDLFNQIGKTWVMKKEEMIDAATAISGSGPAYIFYDMEINKHNPKNLPELVEKNYVQRLSKAAKRVGFDSKTASELAVSTTASSISLSAITGLSPAELRKQVTSKGGTTEAALEILIKGGTWAEAAVAAKKRAEELSKS